VDEPTHDTSTVAAAGTPPRAIAFLPVPAGTDLRNAVRSRRRRETVQMNSPIPAAAIGATAPTSRATFRLIAKCVDATNRDADTLRLDLLARWSEHAGPYDLERRLRALDSSDPAGEQGAEARLAVWFAFAGSDADPIIDDDDPLLAGLSDGFRTRLAAIARPAPD
jgi:hypothetical protein